MLVGRHINARSRSGAAARVPLGGTGVMTGSGTHLFRQGRPLLHRRDQTTMAMHPDFRSPSGLPAAKSRTSRREEPDFPPRRGGVERIA